MTNAIDSAKNRINDEIAYEVKSSLVESFELIKKLFSYFPIRLILFSIFFSYLLLVDNANFFKTLESQIMSISLNFFHIYSLTQSGYLYVGETMMTFPINTQIIFLIFFPSIAFAAKTSISIRLKILGFGLLCFFMMIALQLVLITVLFFMKIPNLADFFIHDDMILSTIVSALVIEFTFFTVLTLPKRTKVIPMIKRNYVYEWSFFGLTMLFTILIFQLLFQFLQISINSVVGVFAALGILSMLSFSNYIGFILAEIRIPKWAKITNQSKSPFIPNVTFLLAAYNEEEFIERTITSIDKAAARYSGKTTIFLVDDGSTDNTAKIVKQSLSNLRHCVGTFITIPNVGKGRALNTGLEMIKDDIIFRMDADSVIEENTIPYMVRHFIDPLVASVGGIIMAIDERSTWQKLFNISSMVFSAFKRNGDLFDSMVIQSGAFSVFRRQALIQAGGWAVDQNGEDGEITVRLGRMGYKNGYDEVGIVLSDAPASVKEVRKQRMRWAAAFYHSRNRNLNILKEFNGPRSVSFMLNLVGHAIGFVSLLFWPFLLASVLAGNVGDVGVVFFSSQNPDEKVPSINALKAIEYLIRIPASLIVVELAIWIFHYAFIAYFLAKYNKLNHYKYVPLLRLYWVVAGTFPRTEALGVLLSWSSRWKIHNKESYQHFVKDLKKVIDTPY